MKRKITYTILDERGDLIADGLPLEDAALKLLAKDGRSYAILGIESGYYVLWARDTNGHWNPTNFTTIADDRMTGEREILQAVVDAAQMNGHYKVVTDQQLE